MGYVLEIQPWGLCPGIKDVKDLLKVRRAHRKETDIFWAVLETIYDIEMIGGYCQRTTPVIIFLN